MQFIKNGPDIPERLLQAHEDGKVVFFCGAGISFPAKLPGFAGLVKNLYVLVNSNRTLSLENFRNQLAINHYSPNAVDPGCNT